MFTLGRGPCLIHLCSSSVSTKVPGEQLNGPSVNAVILGRDKEP